MTVTRTRKGGGLEALAKGLRDIERVSQGGAMEIGIFGDRKHSRGSKPKLAQLLAWHEFGTRTIPARRPIQTYMATKGPAEIAERAKAVLPAVLRGEAQASDALEAIAGVAAAGVRKAIQDRLPPPLSEATKAKPGRNPTMIPLYDTGQLADAITVRVGGRVLRRL